MQGFNMGRYVPPDQEGVVSGNQLHKKHPLGARASKLSRDGSLTVRFEMPFPIWCGTCPKPTIIGQGVRFNAAKRRVGSYYSTPIYSFRMRHAECGGEIEIRTDPQHTTYVVVSGARRRDEGTATGGAAVDDSSLVGDASGRIVPPIETDREREARREHAFAHLEKTIADRAAHEAARERIDELRDDAARRWDDPYARNQSLRRAFRAGRRARERDAAAAADLADRMGLGIELLPSRPEDAARAKLVDFGTAAEDDDGGDNGRSGGRAAEKALAKPLFDSAVAGAISEPKAGESRTSELGKHRGPRRTKGKLKSELEAMRKRESFVAEVVGNTRAAKDPFLVFGNKSSPRTPVRILGIKRKRPAEDVPDPPESGRTGEREGVADLAKGTGSGCGGASGPSLVNYDSD